MNDDDNEAYILLLLSDSNLPTGSFVASSGFESYIKHGFSSSHSNSTITFVRDSLGAYARSALPFVSDAHGAVDHLFKGDSSVETVLTDIATLDEHYHSMTLNHVARRASQSQGVALLSLFAKGFSRPTFISVSESEEEQAKEARLNSFVNKLKEMTRRSDTPGHLPICWGVLTAALGLSLGMLHLLAVSAYRLTEFQNGPNTYIYFYTPEASCPLQFV
jgi:urease accessory protein